MTRTCSSLGSFIVRSAATPTRARARVRKVLGSRVPVPVSPDRETRFLVLESLWLCGGVPGGSTCGRASRLRFLRASIFDCRVPCRVPCSPPAYDAIEIAPATRATASNAAKTSRPTACPASCRSTCGGTATPAKRHASGGRTGSSSPTPPPLLLRESGRELWLGGQGEREVTRVVRPDPGHGEAGLLELCSDLADPELGGDLHPDLLADRQVEDEIGARDLDQLGRLRTQPQVHPLHVGVPERDVGERLEVEVGAELAIEDAQRVAYELLGDPATVVIGRDQPVGALHQVGPEQERVAGLEHDVQRAEEHTAVLKVRVAHSAAEKTRHPGAPARK